MLEGVEVEVRENKIKVVINGKTYHYSVKDHYGQTHLGIALENQDIQEIKMFLDLGFDVNAHGLMGDTAILKVFSISNYSNVYLISKLLLDHGANPYIVNDNGNSAMDYFQHNYPHKQDCDNRLRELIKEYYDDFIVEDDNEYPLPCFDELNLGLIGNVELIDSYSE